MRLVSYLGVTETPELRARREASERSRVEGIVWHEGVRWVDGAKDPQAPSESVPEREVEWSWLPAAPAKKYGWV